MAYAGPAQSRLSDTQSSSLQRYQSMFPQTTQAKSNAPVNAPALATAGKAATSKSSTKSSKPKVSKAEKDYQKSVEKAIKKSYEEGLGFLGEQQARLEQAQPQLETQITGAFEAQVPQIQEQLRQQTVGIRGQQEETRAQRESALASARRQFEEGTQRAQALFGGVAGSSAGLAQSELLAREQARQMGQTQRAAQQNILGLEENLRAAEATTAQALRQVEQEKQTALLRARDQFRAQLDDINSRRFQLAQDRSNRQLAALQDFNNRRRQIEDFYTQQEAQVANLRTQAQIGLENYAQQLQLAQRFTPTAIQSPLSNLAGLNLEALNRANPAQARTLANEIANNPQLLQQYRARIAGDNLEFVTAEGNLGSIPLR